MHPSPVTPAFRRALAALALSLLPACAAGAASAERPLTGDALHDHHESLCLAQQLSTVCEGVFAVPAEDPSLHRLRFIDGQVSANDSCMIRMGNRLNPKVPPMYVNGEPVGFC